MDPFTAYLVGIAAPIAAAIAKAMLTEVIADLPLIMANIRIVNQNTAVDATNPTGPLISALNQEIANAGK